MSTLRMIVKGKRHFFFCFLLAGCASLPSRPVSGGPNPSASDGAFLADARPVKQTLYQCGAAALESVLRYWGVKTDSASLSKSLSSARARGALNIALAQQMKEQGFWTQMDSSSDLRQLKQWVRHGVPPVLALYVGRLGVPLYHFVVITGFDEQQDIFYLNAGRATVESVKEEQLDARWKKSGRWSLIVCPPERVDWPLSAAQAAELALLFEKKGDLDSALRWNLAAAREAPDNPAVQFNLANIYMKKREFEKARSLYEKLAPRHPDWVPLQNNLAWSRLSLGDASGAVQTVLTAFRRGARARPEILDTLGLGYSRLGDSRRALRFFRAAAARVSPENKEMSLQIALHRSECERNV